MAMHVHLVCNCIYVHLVRSGIVEMVCGWFKEYIVTWLVEKLEKFISGVLLFRY